MGIARWLALAVCLIGCKGNAKSKQTAVARDAAVVKSSAAADAAARPDESDEPPVAALGRTDPEEARRITSTYNSIRGLFLLGPDDERAPTAAERRALAEIGARDIEEIATEAAGARPRPGRGLAGWPPSRATSSSRSSGSSCLCVSVTARRRRARSSPPGASPRRCSLSSRPATPSFPTAARPATRRPTARSTRAARSAAAGGRGLLGQQTTRAPRPGRGAR